MMLHSFNALQYRNMQNLHISEENSLSVLKNNEQYLSLEKNFLDKFGFESLNYFSFSSEGFLSLFLKLSKKGKIALSLGESQALIDAALVFEELGFEIVYIPLLKDGSVDYEFIKTLEVDFIFLSSYVMDTFLKTDLEKIKTLCSAKIISNASANFDENSDVIYFDAYKLTGFFTHSIILFNEELLDEQSIGFKDSLALEFISKAIQNCTFNLTQKELFKSKLVEAFGEDIYFFIDNNNTLEYSLHFGLKDIKARELIRTLALNEIFITNGEGCSLGLSKPSRIIQAMGYDETTSRNSISLTFTKEYEEETIEKIVKTMAKKYRQIKVLN
jgi:selenocysteine lyase/cysteine desulfurase